MLKLQEYRAAVLVHRLRQLPVAGNILIVIEVELDGMLHAEGIFDAARFDDEQAHAAFGQGLIVRVRALADVAGGLDIERPARRLYDAVPCPHPADVLGLKQLFKKGAPLMALSRSFPMFLSVTFIRPSGSPMNRVGWGLTALASHTTVRAVRHTAVHESLLKLRCLARKLTSPCWANHLTGTAAFMWEAPAFHHGPWPL